MAAGADIVWRTLAIRGVSGASIEVPNFMKEDVVVEKSSARPLFAATGIDRMGGALLCMLQRQFYSHDKRHLTVVQAQALTASQLTNDPGMACQVSKVPERKYEQNARTVSGLAAASCVTVYTDPNVKDKELEVIETDTMIAAPRYFYQFWCEDDLDEDTRVEVGGKFVWDQELKKQVTHMVDSLKLPAR